MTATPANGDPIPDHSTTGNPLATAGHTWVQNKPTVSPIPPLSLTPLLCGTQSTIEKKKKKNSNLTL